MDAGSFVMLVLPYREIKADHVARLILLPPELRTTDVTRHLKYWYGAFHIARRDHIQNMKLHTFFFAIQRHLLACNSRDRSKDVRITCVPINLLSN